MYRLLPALFLSAITFVAALGSFNNGLAQTSINYCTPLAVKENISIEKLQIGSWVSTTLATTDPKNTVQAAVFGDVYQNYEFSLQGLPQTRDSFYWQIWVDLNQDMDFEDEGESLLKVATPRKQKASGKLLFPATSSNQLRIRVMLSKAKANNPCGTQSKALDYFDFWLLGNCPEIDASKQLEVGRVLENQITLLFNLPENHLIEWHLEGQSPNWSQGGTTMGDSLVLKNLVYFNNYTFRYRLQCGDFSWTSWSDTIALKTKDKPICTPIDVSQVTIDSIGYDHVVITVPPQENSIQFRFSLSSFQGKGDTASNFSSYGKIRVPLRLQGALYIFSGVKKVCTDGTSSDWAEVGLKFTTLVKSCPIPSLDSVTTKFTSTYGIALNYTGKEHTKVTWNYPSYYQQCSLKSDTTQRDLEVWYKNGERISVRLKGVCASGERSPFSDTLWFERPCVGTDSSKFFFENIIDKSAIIRVKVGADWCSRGYHYYVTSDSTLHDSLWNKLKDAGDGNITLQNLLPNTKYFVKISNICYDGKNTTFYSDFKSFKTLPELSTCSPIDSSEIKFRYFSNSYLRVDVNSSKVSAKKELSIEDADGYQSTQRYSFYEYVTASLISTDTRYLIRIKNNCGELESTWSEAIPYTVPIEFCSKMNSARLRFKGEKDKYTLSYVKNPALPISGPYLWRYRQTGYFTWLDTLISDTNFVEIPKSLAGKYLTFSVSSMNSSRCGIIWSNEYTILVRNNFQPEPILSLVSTSVLNGMKLVPNPSTGAFSLELPLEFESWATLSITNLNGQMIHNAQVQLIPGARLPLDLSQQPQGVYLVHLQVGNQLYQEKLVLIK